MINSTSRMFGSHFITVSEIVPLFKMNEYTFMGSNSVVFIFVSLVNESQLLRKEFAPVGANSFFKELTPFWKSYALQESKQGVKKVVSL